MSQLEDVLTYCIFPLILALIAGVRILIAGTAKRDSDWAETEGERGEFAFSRQNTGTLAFFTITVITVALSIAPQLISNPDFVIGVGYLSLAMFCFFIGSYMFIFLGRLASKKDEKLSIFANINVVPRSGEGGSPKLKTELTLPYVGATLEFVGIVSLGIGLFYLVTQVVLKGNMGMEALYLLFFSALVLVAFYALYRAYRAYHPKTIVPVGR